MFMSIIIIFIIVFKLSNKIVNHIKILNVIYNYKL